MADKAQELSEKLYRNYRMARERFALFLGRHAKIVTQQALSLDKSAAC
jgi:hypothetical protein